MKQFACKWWQPSAWDQLMELVEEIVWIDPPDCGLDGHGFISQF
jgi:hypothetical protein